MKKGESSNEKPHYVGHRHRLRQRYLKNGAEALNKYERLELLLTYAISRRDVKPIAKELVKKFKSVKSVLDASVDDLQEVDGIGEQAALLIKLVRDMNSLYLKEKLITGQTIQTPTDIVDYLKHAIGSLKDELFMVLFLNAKSEVLADEVIGEGTVNHAVIYQRKVFETALKHKATSLIIIHNHPGGSLRASESDVVLTRSLEDTARSLSIRIQDHLIITKTGFFSFYEEGLLV